MFAPPRYFRLFFACVYRVFSRFTLLVESVLGWRGGAIASFLAESAQAPPPRERLTNVRRGPSSVVLRTVEDGGMLFL